MQKIEEKIILRFRFNAAAILLLALLLVLQSRAVYAERGLLQTRDVPIETQIRQLEEQVKHPSPEDIKFKSTPDKIYLLARISALAYSLKLKTGKVSGSTPILPNIYYWQADGKGTSGRQLPDPTPGENPQLLEKALKYFKEYSVLHPDSWHGHAGVGWSLILKGDKPEAIKSLRRAMSLFKPEESRINYEAYRKDPRFNLLPNIASGKMLVEGLVPAGTVSVELWQSSKLTSKKSLDDSFLASYAEAGKIRLMLSNHKERVKQFEEAIKAYTAKITKGDYREFKATMEKIFAGVIPESDPDDEFEPWSAKFFHFQEALDDFFKSEGIWPLNKRKPLDADATFVVSFMREEGSQIVHIFPRRSGVSYLNSEREFYEKSYLTAVPFQIRYIDAAGNKLSEINAAGLLAPTLAEIDKKSESYDIKPNVGQIEVAEPAKYLIDLLDAEKDKAEIQSLKKQVLIAKLLNMTTHHVIE